MRRGSQYGTTTAGICMLIVASVGLLLAGGVVGFGRAAPAQVDVFPFPLPSKSGADDFEKRLAAFLTNYGYLKWVHDSEIRNTGPQINDDAYGVHPAVKIYYSQEVIDWLNKGRKGDIPDGAMIIKEQYPTPARQDYTEKDRTGYSIMVRDSAGAWDGWYWSSGIGVGMLGKYPYPFANAGFGNYCVNCHASADNPDGTFSTLNNISGQPMTYMVTQPSMNFHPRRSHDIHDKVTHPAPAPAHSAAAEGSAFGDFLKTYKLSANLAPSPISLPSESLDHVVQGPRPNHQKMFITSDQCIGCHDGTSNIGPVMPNMIYAVPNAKQNKYVNLSPYGEWRASMMGLAGRDPIFYAQLESERALHPEVGATIDNLCLHCHGVMGQRQFEADTHGEKPFTHEMVRASPPDSLAHYGALARDGISCAVCHRIAAEGLGTPETYTGNFKLAKNEEIFGPYQKVSDYPMKTALGLTPQKPKEDQIRSSKLCGSCHTVLTPVLNPGEKYTPEQLKHPTVTSHEQTTYWEWLNSSFNNEVQPTPDTARTCQDCHMTSRYRNDPLKFRIANIEDNNYPFTDNRVPNAKIALAVRGDNKEDKGERYARHTLVGINLFALQMFKQFPDPLGIRPTDPMATYGLSYDSQGNPATDLREAGLATSENASLQLARKETATLRISSVARTADGLEAKVKVTNLTGHKFPSGVGFRRAFLEFQVLDARGNCLWASGRTSEQGVILNGITQTPLPTEFFAQQSYQPYHTEITGGNQVQIYEELFKDKPRGGVFTTSFLALARKVKDTRLMPKGWRATGPEAAQTAPDGGDGRPVGRGYLDQSGSDLVTYRVKLPGGVPAGLRVSATLYYQSIPPYYLNQRFHTAPNGEATRNLLYYTSHLDVTAAASNIKSWKLRVVSATRGL